jgi:hypothetical protein
MKRKAAQRFINRQRKRIKYKLNKAKGIVSPRQRTRRVSYPTPPSSARKIAAQLTGLGVSALAGPTAGILTEAGINTAGLIYNNLTAKGPRKSYGSVTGTMSSGNAVAKRFRNRKQKNPSIATLQKKGVSLRYELRKVASGDNLEAIAVGHTSMPGKVCAIMLWRAAIKHLLMKMGCLIKDYGNLMTAEGFVQNDTFILSRYDSGTANAIVQSPVTVGTTTTYDQLAAQFASILDDQTGLSDDRLDQLEFSPQSSSHWSATNIDLTTLKITCFTKSTLKLQNVTVEVAADNEADDVNRVPLIGKSYLMRGNNFLTRVNRSCLNGFFNQFNEECIIGQFDRQIIAELGGTSVGFYEAAAGPNNANQTTFFKPSEPPKQYELQNCIGIRDIVVGAGEIKQSVLTQKYTFGFQYYFNMLYGKQNTLNDRLVYNPAQGKTSVMYLEKAVGRQATADNSIRLWAELQFEQSVMCHGKAQTFTAPIQYQTNY